MDFLGQLNYPMLSQASLFTGIIYSVAACIYGWLPPGL